MMDLLVVGNGSMGKQNGCYFINHHTGYFLSELNKQVNVTYVESIVQFNENSNLQNFDIANTGINYIPLPKIKNVSYFIIVFRAILNTEFTYLFYPGTISKIFGVISIILRKPIGLYIRGEQYRKNNIDRFILRRAKFIHTVSPSIASDVRKFCSNVNVIKPMISITQNDIKFDRAYKKSNCWNFLFVGRVEQRKGIYDLIEIAEFFRQSNLDFEMNIVGGGRLYEETLKYIRVNKLDKFVKLHGLISNEKLLKELYDEADIFLFTSHDEGFPRVLYEAMASGLPIFTTFVGGISGRMIDGVNCVRIPTRDAKNAGNIILKTIGRIDFLKKIGINAQDTFKEIITGPLLPHEELLIKNIGNREK